MCPVYGDEVGKLTYHIKKGVSPAPAAGGAGAGGGGEGGGEGGGGGGITGGGGTAEQRDSPWVDSLECKIISKHKIGRRLLFAAVAPCSPRTPYPPSATAARRGLVAAYPQQEHPKEKEPKETGNKMDDSVTNASASVTCRPWKWGAGVQRLGQVYEGPL